MDGSAAPPPPSPDNNADMAVADGSPAAAASPLRGSQEQNNNQQNQQQQDQQQQQMRAAMLDVALALAALPYLAAIGPYLQKMGDDALETLGVLPIVWMLNHQHWHGPAANPVHWQGRVSVSTVYFPDDVRQMALKDGVELPPSLALCWRTADDARRAEFVFNHAVSRDTDAADPKPLPNPCADGRCIVCCAFEPHYICVH